MVGENSRGRSSPPRRATLSAAGSAAALAPSSTARTAGGESQTCHHRQASANSVAGTDSFCLSGGADSDSPSFSQQAPTVDLQRTGARNPRQRGISLRQWPTAATQKTGDDSRLEQGLQPRSERSVQRRCYSGQRAARTIPRLLPALARQRHQADRGAPHPGTQDCSHYADTVEEGRRLRYRQTELASRLSVSGKNLFPPPVILVGRVVDRFLRRAGSRVSILIACRHEVPTGT